jgi:hypothetical protein
VRNHVAVRDTFLIHFNIGQRRIFSNKKDILNELAPNIASSGSIINKVLRDDQTEQIFFSNHYYLNLLP